MKSYYASLVVGAILASLVSTASAQVVEGVVVVGERGCKKRDRVVIYTDLGFVIAQQYGGFFDKRDVVVGNLNMFGFQDVLVNGRSARLYIEDYMLSKSRAAEKCFEN